MPTLLVPVHEFNACHEPAGQPTGGQFCAGPGALTGVKLYKPRESYPSVHPGYKGQPVELPDDQWMLITDQGWVELAPSKRYGGPHLSVRNIKVYDEYRAQGYGLALYLAAAKAAKEIGKSTWPEYKGIFSVPELRSEAATRAWSSLKRRFPKRVKTLPHRHSTGLSYQTLEKTGY